MQAGNRGREEGRYGALRTGVNHKLPCKIIQSLISCCTHSAAARWVPTSHSLWLHILCGFCTQLAGSVHCQQQQQRSSP